MPARQDDVRGATASAILEVADGLRWRDPQLSAALAEHAVQLADGDAEVRGAAERSAILALGQLDRAPDVVARALPPLREAERAGRLADAASLRCELAAVAVRCADPDLAETLLGPLAGGDVLPASTRIEALTTWAGARALRGDVEGTDAAAAQADGLLDGDGELALLRRVDLHRVRAAARRARHDVAGALEVLQAAPTPGGLTGGDGGRRVALLAADRVDLLLELRRPADARAAAAETHAWAPEATTSLALGRLRCALAARSHLPAGELDAAEALARSAERDLIARGHGAQAAEAWQVLAAVAEERGDLARTVDALRRAHALALAARDATTRALVALTATATPPPPGRDGVGSTSTTALSDGAVDAPAASRRPRSSHRADERRESEGRDDGPGDLGEATEPPVRPPGARHRGPEPAPVVEQPPELSPEPEAPAPRRRGRYREEPAPDPLLVAPADSGFDAFSTAPSVAPSTPPPAPERGKPGEHGSESTTLAGLLAADGLDAPNGTAGPLDRDSTTGSADTERDDTERDDTERADTERADTERADDRRVRRARERWESAVSLLPRRSDTPDGYAGSATPGDETGGPRVEDDVLAAAARSAPMAASTSDPDGDDELAQELALTLVGLLAEYGGPGPVPSARPDARTSLVAPGVAPRNGHGRGAGARGPGPWRDPRATGDQPDRPGVAVPPARATADSGATLADLLAEAMDAFHRTAQDAPPSGSSSPAAPPGPAPVDGVRRVRR